MDKITDKIIVASKEILKTGKSTKDGRTFDWTLYKIKDNKGRIGSTFDDLPFDTEIEVEISKVTKDGKEYTNFKQVRPNIWAVVRDLQERVEALETEQDEKNIEKAFMPKADEADLGKPIPTSEEELFEPEIKAEDLPF